MTDKEKIIQFIEQRRRTIALFNKDYAGNFAVQVLDRLINDIKDIE